MQIKFLKAGSGDSILVQHNGKNILIDGGNDPRYLIQEVDKIYINKEVIDLIIITHHDDDHIKGIIELLKLVLNNTYPDSPNFIKQVIFNSTLGIERTSDANDSNLSYKQAYEVENLLNKLNVKSEVFTKESLPINFDDLILRFHSPIQADLAKYVEKDPYYLTSDFRCDWEPSMQILDKYIDDSSQDKSLSNTTSIVVTIECEGKKILLTGDITPLRLENIIQEMVELNGSSPINFDYVKLPHHGSYKSLNKNILQNISCLNYIIQTNSSKYYLPNKRALLKVLKYSNRKKGDKIRFFFNYPQPISNLKISAAEKNFYSFELIENNHSYGIFI